MKKLLLSIAAVAFILAPAVAQTEQGSIIAGGSVSLDLNSQKAEDPSGTSVDIGSSTNISFNPTFGYFVIDNLALGLEIGISSSKFESDDGTFESKNSVTAFGPFVKYYLDNGVFGMGSVGFGSANSEFTSGGSTTSNDLSVFQWRIGVGYAAFLNEFVAVEPMVSYGSQSLTDDADFKDIESGITIGAGFTIFIH